MTHVVLDWYLGYTLQFINQFLDNYLLNNVSAYRNKIIFLSVNCSFSVFVNFHHDYCSGIMTYGASCSSLLSMCRSLSMDSYTECFNWSENLQLKGRNNKEGEVKSVLRIFCALNIVCATGRVCLHVVF